MEATVLQRPESLYEIFDRKPGADKTSTHYCPGCGHGVIHKLVAEALDDFGIRDRTVFVSPVGCAVFAYYYMNCGNIQAAHGRAPAVATGVRRMLPHSIVISYQGDGDLAAIGGNEILHAANRGENMTVIFVNNAIYGMTGGQMAPTTLLGMKTTTTPFGRNVANEGYPIRVCELLATLEAPAYIERVAITEAKNVMAARKAIRKAIQYQMEGRGFSLVELLSTCPTGWNLSPTTAKKWLIENMLPVFPVGVFRDKKDTGVKIAPSNGVAHEAQTLRRLLDIPDGKNIEQQKKNRFAPSLSPRLKIAGFGGQGILFMGVALAEAGMRAGRQVSWLPSYGPEMRGGTANCHVTISDRPIGSPLVSETDVLIAMNRPSLEKFQTDVCPNGLILYDSALISGLIPQGGKEVQVIAIPATSIADQLGNAKVANVVMLGAYLAFSNLLPDQVLLDAINEKAHSRPGLAEFNTKAFFAGKEFVRSNAACSHAFRRNNIDVQQTLQ